MLDLLLWWFGGVFDVIEYLDDSMGGVEANCQLSLILQSPTGPVRGSVRLSREHKLRDTVVVRGDRFTIEYDFSDKVRMWPGASDDKDQSFVSESTLLPRSRRNGAEQLRAFARAIVTKGESAVPGESVLGCIALIEQCYRQRRPLELPWMKRHYLETG